MNRRVKSRVKKSVDVPNGMPAPQNPPSIILAPSASTIEFNEILRKDFDFKIKSKRHKAKQAVYDFVDGAACGDLVRMYKGYCGLSHGESKGSGWARAMRLIARLPSVPAATQGYFLDIFITHGDHLRQECGDELVFIAGLRVLLPRYDGPAMRLYRGESFHNRSRRTYGWSWSADPEVGRAFSETGLYRTFPGGAVLLETFAPASAIICAIPSQNDRYGEMEYVVDRTRLTSVTVIERFSELTYDELVCLQAKA